MRGSSQETEAPERVLVGAQATEVEALRVDVADLAQLAVLAQLLEGDQRRVVGEQVADHQHPLALGGEGDEALGGSHVAGQWLLDEAVAAGGERQLGERGVRGVDTLVGEHLAEVGGETGLREHRPHPLAPPGVGVAAPGQLATGQGVQVARDIGPPVAEPGDPNAKHDVPPR